jgi:hypothetical protein
VTEICWVFLLAFSISVKPCLMTLLLWLGSIQYYNQHSFLLRIKCISDNLLRYFTLFNI